MAAFLPAAIQAGSGLISGFFNARAAKRAARTQAEAADRVTRLGQETGERTARDVTYAGDASADEVNRLAQEGAFDIRNTSWRQAEGIRDSTGRGVTRIGEATERGIGEVNAGVGGGNEILADMLNKGREYYDPYVAAGREGLEGLRADAAGPGFKFSEDDPSYQWRLQQGMQALEKSAATRGLLRSGSILKGMTGYAQGMASTEYQAAFNRYLAERKQRADTYGQLAGYGLTAAGGAANLGRDIG